MVYTIKYDEENYSFVISKLEKESWFSQGIVRYDVEPYDGVLKSMSINLDVLIPVNDFEDYAHTYSNVFIEELDIRTNSDLIGTSFGDNFPKLKDIAYPIFEEVYKTQSKKKLHFYFENDEGQVKYIYLDVIYDGGNILIVTNNTTDSLLKSHRQSIYSNSQYDDVSYNYIMDMAGNYFYGSKIYELIEREPSPDDFKKDIIFELIVSRDKELYKSLVSDDAVKGDNNVYIVTENGNEKSLIVSSNKLYIDGELSQIAFTITDISKIIDRKDKLLMNKLLTKLDNKLSVGTLIKNTNGEFIISNALYNVLHLPKKDIMSLTKDYKKYIVNADDVQVIDDFVLGKISNVEREIQYKSPNHDKIQHLFIYLERHAEDENNLFFMGIKDITKEIETKEDLMSQNEKLKVLSCVVDDIQESTSLAIYYMDSEGKYHWSNESYQIIGRKPRPEDDYTNIFKNLISQERHEDNKNIISNLRNNEFDMRDFEIKTEEGKTKYLRGTARKVFDKDGNFLRLSMTAMDRTKEHLQEQNIEILNSLMSDSNYELGVGGYVHELGGDCLKITKEAVNITEIDTNMDPYAQLETFCKCFVDSEGFIEEVRKLIFDEIDEIDGIWDYKSPKTGEIKKLHVINYKKVIGGKVYSIGGIKDVTSEMEKQEKLEQYNKEMEILIRESNHRIKNNLNLLHRFISLEKRFNGDDPNVIIENTIGRIESLSLFHDKLYKTDNLKDINVSGFLQSFIDGLTVLYGSEYNFTMDCGTNEDDFELSGDIIIPVVLILNELVINSVKYAYDDYGMDYKKIVICLGVFDDKIKLHYGDNGKGLPSGFDSNKSTGLGWTVIKSLTDQLDGEYEVFNDDGMHCILSFPISSIHKDS